VHFAGELAYIRYKAHDVVLDDIGAAYREPGERVDLVAVVIDGYFVGELVPGKTVVRQLDRIAFERDTRANREAPVFLSSSLFLVAGAPGFRYPNGNDFAFRGYGAF
jgi:hypothetical protein